MITVFAGCRYLDVGPWWWPALDAVAAEHGITEVWHGACSLDRERPWKLAGADLGIDTWARVRGLVVCMFPAPWKIYSHAGLDPKSAGMRRAADMLRGDRGYAIEGERQGFRTARVVTTETVPGSPSLVVALPGGPGTQGTAKIGERMGLPVVRVSYQHKPGVPRLINAHHYAEPGKRGDRRPPLPVGAVYIGRSKPWGGPSPLGNPYSVQQHGSRALELYRGWLREKLRRRDPVVLEALRAIPADAHLVCHCVRPDGSGACHGRVVALAWEWLRTRDEKQAAARRDLEERLDRVVADALAGGDRPVAAAGEIAC